MHKLIKQHIEQLCKEYWEEMERQMQEFLDQGYKEEDLCIISSVRMDGTPDRIGLKSEISPCGD